MEEKNKVSLSVKLLLTKNEPEDRSSEIDSNEKSSNQMVPEEIESKSKKKPKKSGFFSCLRHRSHSNSSIIAENAGNLKLHLELEKQNSPENIKEKSPKDSGVTNKIEDSVENLESSNNITVHEASSGKNNKKESTCCLDSERPLFIELDADSVICTEDSDRAVGEKPAWIKSYYDNEMTDLREKLSQYEKEINDFDSSASRKIDMQSSYIYDDQTGKKTNIKWCLQRQLEIVLIDNDAEINTNV